MKGLLQECGPGQGHLAGAAMQSGPGDRSKRRPEVTAAGELWPWDCRQEGARRTPPAPSAPSPTGKQESRGRAGRAGGQTRRTSRAGTG